MNKSDIVEHEFFASLEDKIVATLCENVGERLFSSGDYLFRQNETADEFFLVQSGDIRVGNEIEGKLINERILQPGDVVGWSWLVPPYRWSTTAIAQSETRVFVFDGIELLVECENNPTIGYALFKRFSGVMGQRLAEIHDPGVGRERRPVLKGVLDSIEQMERNPRDRNQFLAI